MISLVVVIALIYLRQVYLFYKGWHNLKVYGTDFSPKVSVVIALRNEEVNIPYLLEDLFKQDYPQEDIEFILVDDFSTDASYDLLQQSNFPIKVIRSSKEGKKAAISRGVSSAQYDFILTTDADCRLSSDWVKQMLSPFADDNVHLVSGPVSYTNLNTVFDKFQAIEFMSLIGSGAGAIGADTAFMCNGANMAFRKSIFSSTNEHIASGDDVFLLHHVKKSNAKIAFVKEQSAIVFTSPKKSVTAFINQRKRWASKSSSYTDIAAQWVSVVVFLTNLLILLLLFIGKFKLLLILFLVKVLIDYRFVKSLSRFFFYEKYLSYYWLMSILYPFYIVWVALSSQLSSYEWKERKHQR
jgi:cellulose synthase/poly-beta-1,6-N-acetylglucosamine synthase-like glycosyltransferase